MNIKTFIILMLILPFAACSSAQKKPAAAVAKRFSIPEVPSMLTTSEQRAEFVVTHYWGNFDFVDTTLIGNADITEQAFAGFVNILLNISQPLVEKGVAAMLGKAAADRAMYTHFMELSEKYLYDPNSPMRNEDIYIVVLRNIVANAKLDDIYKVRPRYQLALALKNRIGDKAIDFTYTSEKGVKAKLYTTSGDPMLIFFFRPDCPSCKEAKNYIATNGIDKRIKILYVNPDIDRHIDTLYDLRASPTLYLLDKDKTVILKDATIEHIEEYLVRN